MAVDVVEAWDLVVALDHGQMCLSGDADVDFEAAFDALAHAVAGDGIGQVGDTVVVLSPHQNNFQMPLRVEVWSRPPGLDLAEWQEVFESSLAVDSGGLRYDSPDMSTHIVEVPEGLYAVRISGRGFVARGWPGSTTPGDSWRVQLWPTTDRTSPSRLAAWEQPAREVSPVARILRQQTPAVAADLRSGIAPDQLDTLSVETTCAGLQREVFDLAATLDWFGLELDVPPLVPGAVMYQRGWWDQPNEIAGGHAILRFTVIGASAPERIALAMQWLVGPVPGESPAFDERRPFLREDSTIEIHVRANSDESASVELTHRGIPHAWKQDLTSFWSECLSVLRDLAK